MKFGIIGTNFVSDFFMNGAIQEPECEVVAVSDISITSAEKFASKYGIPNYFDSFEKMYEANLIEAVYVAVPNGLHLAISKYFLERKIPTFCEKPLAGNHREVLELVKCSIDNNTYLQEGLVPLYNPNFTALKKSLAMVGDIRQVTFNFSKYSSRYDSYLAGENPTTFRSELANGAIMDLGVYPIGDCIGLFGEPKQIHSASTLLDTKADVSGTSIFMYDNFNVTISYSKASDTNIISEICGELGTITIDMMSRLENIYFTDRLTKQKTRIGFELKEGFYYEINDMIANVKLGKIESDKIPHKTSIAVHKVITECRNQAVIVYPCD